MKEKPNSEASTTPRIGILWGDFSQTTPLKLGKLWSMGRVARNVTNALQSCGHVVPYRHSQEMAPFSFDISSTAERERLVEFLQSIDILWADLYPASTFALALREELQLPCSAILFAGGVLPKGAEAMLFPWQRLLRSTDVLVFTSRADQAIWKRLITVSHLREWVVPLSVDEQIFFPHTHEERQRTRERYGIAPNAPLLLYVGRINIQKNLHTLFYVLATVRKLMPDASLYIVGEEDTIALNEFAVPNTGYLAWLQHLATHLGLAAHVRFLGPLFERDLAAIYSAADIVVNFSLYHRENFGLSQAEAAACAVPVVCTDWAGFKEVVQPGVTGYGVETILTKHGIRVNWAQALRPLVGLLEQGTLREEMGRRAASYAREHLSGVALQQSLARVIAEVQLAGTAYAELAYQPSTFAENYEAHKRACGWYAPKDDEGWYPRMFQGEAYALYETLIQPYATRLAQETKPIDLLPNWIPYFPSVVQIDPRRRLLLDDDPIWPHRRFLTVGEWEIVHCLDGYCTLEEMAQKNFGGDLSTCRSLIWKLYLDGFILFSENPVTLSLAISLA